MRPGPVLWTAPNIVTLSRLALAPVLLALAWAGAANTFLALLCLSLATDIVDGKLARHLGQTSVLGARLDSWADFATYAAILPCAQWLRPDLVRDQAHCFWSLAASLLVPKLYGFLKFGKLTGYHTRGSVLSSYVVGVAVVLAFADLAVWPLRLAALFVVIPTLEDMAITTVLPRQVAMVPSLRRALELRRELTTSCREASWPV
jgi:CDP-diacylglycerol--glycerol-3-phosphate 3-phosphatidyltransferase